MKTSIAPTDQSGEFETAQDVPIRSISRAIAIMTALKHHGAMSMTAISKLTSLPHPTVSRIIQTLLHEGLVEYQPTSRSYRVAPFVSALSPGYQSSNELVTVARSHIERLCLETAWPVSLLTRFGAQMILCDSTHTMTSQTSDTYFPGHTVPVAGSASGKVHLAFCGEAERRSIFDTWKKSDDPSAAQGLQILADDGLMHKIRTQKHAFYTRDFDGVETNRTTALSVPILGNDGNILASLTLIYFSSTMLPDAAIRRYLETMLVAAENISADMWQNVSKVSL